ncbi:MAG: hypothetical protein M3Z13_07215, partial [Candidatus Dormibacteraeota bacterium]|nr:hypothetical protein [Candidatus Dormibacteraeota bacterium]
AIAPAAVFTLAIAALTPMGLLGGSVQLIAGGFAAALMVGVTATIAQRAQSRDLDLLGGMGARMPKLSWFLILAGSAVVGVPGFASFIGEAMALFGAFRNQPAASFGVALGIVLMTVGLGVLLQRVIFGGIRANSPGASDASPGEVWYLGLLVGALLWWGIFPGGPKLGGSVTLFDPGIVNILNASSSDIGTPYLPEAGAR